MLNLQKFLKNWKSSKKSWLGSRLVNPWWINKVITQAKEITLKIDDTQILAEIKHQVNGISITESMVILAVYYFIIVSVMPTRRHIGLF